MPVDVVNLRIEGGVAVITLNRPDVHNVVDGEVMARLESVLDRVEAEPAVRVLILTGAGDRTFSAGGDLKYFAGLETREAGIEMSERMQAILSRFHDGERVVIAAVNGQALGGGCEILTACHLRVAAETARFGFRQAANGLITGWGGGRRLFALVGRSHALDLLLTSRILDVNEALRMGLIDRRVPPVEVLAEARRLAELVCANSARSVRAVLELTRCVDREGREATVRLETKLFGDCWESEDFRQARRRFNDRRADQGEDD